MERHGAIGKPFHELANLGEIALVQFGGCALRHDVPARHQEAVVGDRREQRERDRNGGSGVTVAEGDVAYRQDEARLAYERARALARTDPERRFLERRIAELEDR